MNVSDRTTQRVREWLRRSTPVSPDAERSVDEVMTNLFQSSQLRPRSSFRLLRGRDGGTGGHSMFSALKLGLATAVVALVGGVLAIGALPAQPAPQVPTAATDSTAPEVGLVSLAPHAAITGRLSVTAQTNAANTEIDPETGREIGTDWAYAARFTTNDPRLDGEFLNNKNYYLFEGENGLSGSLKSGVGSLTNEGGSWSVEFHGFSKPGESDYSHNHYVVYLTGEDGYDGLSAMLLCINAGSHWAVDGVIAPGPLPEPPTTVDPTVAE